MKMHFSTVFFLCLIPSTVAIVTIQVEAESLSHGHTVMDRTSASKLKTVRLSTTAESLSFPFCLYRQFSDAVITVAYSSDGGEDVVRVKVDEAQNLTFKSVTESKGRENWNVFRSVVFQNVRLNRGYNFLTLIFESLDVYGIEIDYVNVSVDDDFMTAEVFRCQLVLGVEPQFSSSGRSGVSAGYVAQHSYLTTCAEEDNVHLPVYHASVQQYTLTASNPLYRSLYDVKTSDFTNCPNFELVFWRFEDIAIKGSGDSWEPSFPKPNQNDAHMVGVLLNAFSRSTSVAAYEVMYTVSFKLKGFKTGFIDADIYSNLKAEFCRTDDASSSSSSPTPSVSVSFMNRQGQEVLLDTFDLPNSRVTRNWVLPEMTWSEERRNSLTVNVTTRDVMLCTLELIRGSLGPDQAVELYSSDAVVLQGFRTDFWWRRPLRENLTVTVGSQTTSDLSFVVVYVPVPWTGQGSYQQIMVLYQDGNVRMLPLPYSSPHHNKWTPFGTSVIVGRSNPSDLRPAASIKHLTFHPESMQMALTYYDGSSCTLTLTFSVSETRLRVTDLHFPSSTSGLPFATFRSMFVAFGNTDSDSVQSEVEGPVHVLGSWERLTGTEFLLHRKVESHHLTQSPDLRITIEA